MTRRLALTTILALAAIGGFSSNAVAGATGQQIAGCAQAALPPATPQPAVTCTCNGMTMTFANFGAMVLHMRAG